MRWEEKPLGDLCSIQLGKTPARKSPRFWDPDKETENVWLSISDLSHGQVVGDSVEYVSNEALSIMKIVPEGTLMVSFKLTLGRTSVAARDLYTNEAIAAILNLDPSVNQRFLMHFFDRFDWKKACEGDEKLKGYTFNKAKLNVLEIPIPPVEEQERIVGALDEAFASIDKAKANIERNLNNARELFQSRLNDIFSNPSEDWEVKSLGELGKVSMCKRILKHQTTSEGDIPFFKIGTFGKSPNAFIDEKTYLSFKQKFSFPKKGDILISAAGTIGRRVIYDGEPAYFQDSNIVWIDNDEELVSNEYLYEFYGVCDWNPSKGATISRLYNADLRRIKIPFPKLLEQKNLVKKIVALRENYESVQSLYEEKLNNLSDLKQSILEQAFEGKLTEPVAA